MHHYYRVIASESSLFYPLKKYLLSFVSLAGLLILSLFCALPVHALSIVTAQTIKGTEPYLMLPDGTLLTDLSQLVEFSMPNRDGTPGREVIDLSMSGTGIPVPDGMKFSDVFTIVAATGTSMPMDSVSVFDADGDEGSATGTVKVTWKNNGVIIPLSEQNQPLSTCEGPYTLEITADSPVFALTTYGNPRVNLYGTSPTVKYTLVPSKLEICYIQPASMKVYYTESIVGQNSKYANGYNPATWRYDPVTLVHKGFKPNSGFPKTGFNKANFTLLGSGANQSKYKCELDAGSAGNWVTLSATAASASLGQGCKITYNTATRPTTSVTLNMSYNDGASWVKIGSYTIPVPDKWALPLTTTYAYANSETLELATGFPLLDACRVKLGVGGKTTVAEARGQTEDNRAFRQQYLYRRDEITNGPYAYLEEGTNAKQGTNYFSRDADGTFMGEWGSIYSYIGSGFDTTSWYYMGEEWSNARPYTISSRGDVGDNYPSSAGGAICRG